jgi:hypothetical protein
MRWTEHAACMGDIKNAFEIPVGKPEEKRLFRIPKNR